LESPRITVIVVNYNVEHFLELCLTSVQAASHDLDVEVMVVDNHSSDDSMKRVKERFPDVIRIENTENLGFSRANNQAIRQATGRYILLLNPDTVITENTLRDCLDFMEEEPGAGALGVRMTDGSGNYLPESKRGLPTPWVSFCKAFGLNWLFPGSRRFGGYYLSYLDERKNHRVDVLSGAFMWLRKEALEKAGLLDESFFMYGEDVDLSYRITKAGYSNHYLGSLTILHFKGESTRRGSVSFVLHFYKAMILFSRKHFSGVPGFTLFLSIGILVRACIALGRRVISGSASFLGEFAAAYAGMIFIKNWWELNFKGVPGMYPDYFIRLLVPAYILVWIGCVRILGRYARTYGQGNILRGIALGTIIISGVTNFFDEFRFSKGLILIGAVWTYTVLSLRHLLWQWQNRKTAGFQSGKRRRILVAGGPADLAPARQLLSQYPEELVLCGWAGQPGASEQVSGWMGPLDSIGRIREQMGIDEVLFCSGTLTFSTILSLLETNRHSGLTFSFLPEGGRFLVSSSEKHNRGTIRQSGSIPDLIRPHNLRIKRLIDVVAALSLFILFPLIFWRFSRPGSFLANLLTVLKGKKTWIGLASEQYRSHGLRPGVITMADLAGEGAPKEMVAALDGLYLGEFHAEEEIWNLVKNLRRLGYQPGKE
jgi:GT2 family glycosyltransferase